MASRLHEDAAAPALAACECAVQVPSCELQMGCGLVGLPCQLELGLQKWLSLIIVWRSHNAIFSMVLVQDLLHAYMSEAA